LTAFVEHLVADLRRANLLPQNGIRVGVLRILALPLYQQARVLGMIRLVTHGPRAFQSLGRLALRTLYLIEVSPKVTIGRSLRLPHPQGIVLGDGVTIGEDVSIAQRVTIGGNFRKTREREGAWQKLPIVGSRVVIGPGAVIAGPVVVGDDVVIGANAVITKDVPSNSIAFGLSRISAKRIKVDPSGAYSEIGTNGTPDAIGPSRDA
jgi:serine acetyltransferase